MGPLKAKAKLRKPVILISDDSAIPFMESALCLYTGVNTPYTSAGAGVILFNMKMMQTFTITFGGLIALASRDWLPRWQDVSVRISSTGYSAGMRLTTQTSLPSAKGWSV